MDLRRQLRALRLDLVLVLLAPLLPETLTPTMKLKRLPIAEKYATEIEALYA